MHAIEKRCCDQRLQARKEERVESKAKKLGHPIHPILISFPFGLLSTSVVFDVVHLLGKTHMSDGVASSEVSGSRRTT